MGSWGVNTCADRPILDAVSLRCTCLHLAQAENRCVATFRPVIRVLRTRFAHVSLSAFDPKRLLIWTCDEGQLLLRMAQMMTHVVVFLLRPQQVRGFFVGKVHNDRDSDS
jgi:hypothetical protein